MDWWQISPMSAFTTTSTLPPSITPPTASKRKYDNCLEKEDLIVWDLISRSVLGLYSPLIPNTSFLPARSMIKL